MTASPAHDGPEREQLLAEITALLAKATGEDQGWAGEITFATRLERDLYLDSLEMAALCDLAREAYGDRVDLAAYLSGLDIDQLIGLTVGDLVAEVEAVRRAAARPGPGGAGAER